MNVDLSFLVEECFDEIENIVGGNFIYALET